MPEEVERFNAVDVSLLDTPFSERGAFRLATAYRTSNGILGLKGNKKTKRAERLEGGWAVLIADNTRATYTTDGAETYPALLAKLNAGGVV